ncbi:MAG: adenylate cyclase, partial [Desulfobacteraceae bacterium]|nr:adenylate cyclase [Desulfobacteraceae bacterium]
MASSTPSFSLTNFESLWETLDEESKALIVEQACDLSPELGILPILRGITSFHFNLRSKAKKSLESLKDIIQQQLKNTEDPKIYDSGLEASAMISAKIYQQIRPEMPFNDMTFFLKTLLWLGDKGAYFAFKAVYQEVISLDSLKKVVQSVEQPERLLLVDQYLQATPADRLKFGKLFKKILGTINSREPVIEFYASLFDRKRDADPFLNNISFNLRDPETIIQNEIASPSPAIKIAGLKALSLMETNVPVQLLLETIKKEEVKKIREAVYSIIENSSMGLYPELFDPVLAHFYKCDRREAINAFKALVVTGKVPIHKLFRMVRDTYPEIMPFIHIEIASLSRIS